MSLRYPNPVISISRDSVKWRLVLPAVKASRSIHFVDEKMKDVNPFYYEQFEQYLMTKWIKPDDKVLELGGRLGVVSYTIQSFLKNKKNHVVVEPNQKIVGALRENKKRTHSHFHIETRIISNRKLKFVQMKESLGSFATEKYITPLDI